MTPMTCIRRIALTGLLAGMAPHHAIADVVVVVSASSAINNLSEQDVAAIFLGRCSDVGGAILVPIDQPEDSVQRHDFYQRLTGKSAAQLKAYWSRIIFTGAGQPPREVAGDAATKLALAKDKAAIGYMDASSLDAHLKVVLVLR
ncbi:MAG: phosphate ABC transporter substrate-binding protein [Janthinobacterium lividum]